MEKELRHARAAASVCSSMTKFKVEAKRRTRRIRKDIFLKSDFGLPTQRIWRAYVPKAVVVVNQACIRTIGHSVNGDIHGGDRS